MTPWITTNCSLLTFYCLYSHRISGREETIEQVEEETETYKDKNQHLKEKVHFYIKNNLQVISI